ncbi:DedA family protein [Sphingomonas montanisoli]|uniref:DedA family protein n=1 Tax=Sphingomonas montanisoli TaxID=2606412 RepID=A0A5D9C587_9SPHN|nr:DedA family protein [Sphingomonas montanisoli]TZG26352.1 DedA family protein [Sphingomonas montanisoli]
MAGLDHLLEYGAWAIALGAGFEGETAAIAGGVMAHRGILTPVEAWLAIAFGAFTADELFFLLGRRFRDRPFVQRARQKPAFAKAIGFVERYPNAYVLLFRFLYGLRMVSPIAIGLTQMRWRRFATLNVIAALIWSAIFVTIGYLFGPAVDRLLASLAPYKTELMIAFPIPGTCFLIWLWWRKRRARKRAALVSIEAEA